MGFFVDPSFGVVEIWILVIIAEIRISVFNLDYYSYHVKLHVFSFSQHFPAFASLCLVYVVFLVYFSNCFSLCGAISFAFP